MEDNLGHTLVPSNLSRSDIGQETHEDDNSDESDVIIVESRQQSEPYDFEENAGEISDGNYESDEDENIEEIEYVEEVDKEVKKCIGCGEEAISKIAHLKRRPNRKCKVIYFEKYSTPNWNPDVDSLEKEDWTMLGKLLKVEAEKEKRRNKVYRDALNKRKKEARKHLKEDDKVCHTQFLRCVGNILSKPCQCCRSFVTPSKLQTLEVGNIFQLELVRKGEIEAFDEALVCKVCKQVIDSEERMKLIDGDANDVLNAEYIQWREQFSVDGKLKQLYKRIKSKPMNVGVTMFNEEDGRHTVVFPVAKPGESQFLIEEKQAGSSNLEPTVLLPQTPFETDPVDYVSRLEVNIVNHSPSQDFLTQASYFVQMKYAVKVRTDRNKETKSGIVRGNNLKIKDVDSLDGCLKKIKGSVDNLKRDREGMNFRHQQNGLKNICFRWVVCSGKSQVKNDPDLAVCILRMHGHKVTWVEKGCAESVPNREYRVACQEDCDPFNCVLVEVHPTPIEKLKLVGHEINLLVLTRFISEKIQAYVNQIIKPLSQEHCLFLSFERPVKEDGNSGYALVGQIWTDDLAAFNLSGESIPKNTQFIPGPLHHDNVTKVWGNEGSVEVIESQLTWENSCYSLDGNGDISELTKRKLYFDDMENCRETGVLEMIQYCCKEMPISWSSQDTVTINTKDPRKCWKSYRKSKREDKDQEKVFCSKRTGDFWVEEDSIVKNYNDRPLKAEPIPVIQFGLQYKELKKSNLNFEVKLAELIINGGVLADTEEMVKLVTNETRFPHADVYLPKFLLLENQKILVLKKKQNVLKFDNPGAEFTTLLLCEPWRIPEDFDQLEADPEVMSKAKLRMKKILPFSSYPEVLSV